MERYLRSNGFLLVLTRAFHKTVSQLSMYGVRFPKVGLSVRATYKVES